MEVIGGFLGNYAFLFLSSLSSLGSWILIFFALLLGSLYSMVYTTNPLLVFVIALLISCLFITLYTYRYPHVFNLMQDHIRQTQVWPNAYFPLLPFRGFLSAWLTLVMLITILSWIMSSNALFYIKLSHGYQYKNVSVNNTVSLTGKWPESYEWVDHIVGWNPQPLITDSSISSTYLLYALIPFSDNMVRYWVFCQIQKFNETISIQDLLIQSNCGWGNFTLLENGTKIQFNTHVVGYDDHSQLPDVIIDGENDFLKNNNLLMANSATLRLYSAEYWTYFLEQASFQWYITIILIVLTIFCLCVDFFTYIVLFRHLPSTCHNNSEPFPIQNEEEENLRTLNEWSLSLSKEEKTPKADSTSEVTFGSSREIEETEWKEEIPTEVGEVVEVSTIKDLH